MARKSTGNKNKRELERTWRRVDVRFSLLAILISVIGVGIQIYQDIRDNTEEINLHSFRPAAKGEEYSFEDGLFGGEKIISLPFEILISNTGKNTVSLINYRLIQRNNTGLLYPEYHTGMNQGFTDEDEKEIDIPFIILAGESKLVRIHTGIKIKEDIYQKINQVYKVEYGKDITSEDTFTYGELQYYQVKAKTDFYGNKLEGSAFKDTDGEAGAIVSYPTNMRYPEFWLTFKTASSNYFEIAYHEYRTTEF
jgi:hypothetical protein